MRADRDLGFTDEQLMLRDAVRDFVRKEMPDAEPRRCDREKIAPLAPFDEMGGLGVAIPEEYGGSGLGFVGLGIIQEGLSCGLHELAMPAPDFPMEQRGRDARLMRIGSGASEVMRNSIAKDLGL